MRPSGRAVCRSSAFSPRFGHCPAAVLHSAGRSAGRPPLGCPTAPGAGQLSIVDRMPVALGPRPLPRVVLSSDIGVNATREARKRGLVQVGRGAFVEPAVDQRRWATAHHLALAAVAAAARRLTVRGVFSHESAALIHGLWLLRSPEDVHLTQPYKPRRQTPGLRRHTAALPASDVTEVEGLRVTSIERTIVDCAKTLHPRDALVVADSGMRLLLQPRRNQREELAERVEQLRARLLELVERGARHGRPQARAVIAHADPWSESPYETVIRWIAVSRGLPPPILQVRFDVRGRTYYTDLCWLFEFTIDGRTFRVRLLCEYDGEQKYAGDDLGVAVSTAVERVLAEKRREDDLRSMPWTTMVRFDRRDTRREDETFRRLCEQLPPSYTARLRPVPALLGSTSPR